jgi:hypothetical protein
MSCETPFIQSGALPGISTNEALGVGQSRNIPILIADCNGNAMPADTKVSVKTTDLVKATASVSPDTALGKSVEPSIINLSLTGDATDPAKGFLSIVITGGGATTSIPIKIN